MSLRGEQETEALRRLFGEIHDSIEAEYARLASNPSYWRGRRLSGMQERLRQQIQRVEAEARVWYGERLPSLYLDGAREIKDNFILTKNDMKLIADVQAQGLLNIQVSNRLAMKDVAGWADIAKRAGPKRWNKVRGIVTKDGRRYQPDRYADLVTIADANRMMNLGAITAADRAGIKRLLVEDGSACGWTHHYDSQKAAGRVVTLDEAASHPLSHPYCVRSFSPAPNQPGKGRQRAEKIAKAAALTATAGAVGTVAGAVALATSPSLQLRFTNLLTKASPAFTDLRHRVLVEASRLHILEQEVYDGIQGEMSTWVETGEAVSERTKRLLGQNVSAPMKVVGDDYESSYDYIRMRTLAQDELDLQNSVGGTVLHLFDSAGNIGLDVPRVFGSKRSFGGHYIGTFGRATGRIGRDMSGSWSKQFGETFKLGAFQKTLDSGVSKYLSISPRGVFKYRVSKVKYGVAHHFVMNPNGLLRAGFAIDPRTGYIIPNLRLLPKGPIRIFSEVNRSRGRFIEGNILVKEIEALMTPGEKTATGIKRVAHDIIRKGSGAGKRFLRVEDFKPGVVKDLLFVPDFTLYGEASGIIRRGRIPNALSVVIDGKRTAVDLFIRDGKFITTHAEGQGRITSVSTVVRVILPKGAKFNIRTNLNLRALQLESLKDIRHLHLRDLGKLDLRRDFHIRSFSTELRFFGYSPWQISKILRLPWDDAVRMWRDAEALMNEGFQQSYLKFLGTTSFFADLGPAKIMNMIGSGVQGAAEAAADGFRAMVGEVRSNPIKFVLQKHDFAKISEPVELKYKRPDIPSILGDDSALAHELHRLMDVLARQPEEIAKIYDISLDEAEDIWHRANGAVYTLIQREGLNNLSDMKLNPVLRFVTTMKNDGKIVDLSRLDLSALPIRDSKHEASEVFQQIEGMSAYLADRFPKMERTHVMVMPDDVAEYISANSNALAIDAGQMPFLRSKLKQGGFIEFLDSLPPVASGSDDGIVFLAQHQVVRMANGPRSTAAVIDAMTNWHPFMDGYDHELSTMVHEFGHRAMRSLTPSQHFDLLEKIFNMPDFTAAKALRGKLGRLRAATTRQQKNLAEDRVHDLFMDAVYQGNNLQLISEGLSEYGQTNFAEFVAEAFSEFIMSPNPRPMARLVGEFLERSLS